MRNGRVTAQSSMADTVLAMFDIEVPGSVKDISTNPPPANIYQLMKTHVINTFTVSDEAKLRQFLKGGVGMPFVRHRYV